MASRDKVNSLTLPELERSVCFNSNDITVVTHFELYRAQGGVPTTRMLDKWLFAMQRLQADRVINDYSNRAPYQTHNLNAVNIGPSATNTGTVNINAPPIPSIAAANARIQQPTAIPVANIATNTIEASTTKSFFYEGGPTVKACVTVVMESSVAFATGYFEHKNQEAAANATRRDKVTDKFSIGAAYLGKAWVFGH
ncbi:uncharacterized protein PAC_04072 [Phialocephala subalpina]|uniref:Uncharacterized protein n=1 Tax=Phialocephala subalpina TaxID=576137 RepID=A0A1L7WN40_9HELO|nr:uncharacterized protein PAC_04072 [Phialocephala subalpina]